MIPVGMQPNNVVVKSFLVMVPSGSRGAPLCTAEREGCSSLKLTAR